MSIVVDISGRSLPPVHIWYCNGTVTGTCDVFLFCRYRAAKRLRVSRSRWRATLLKYAALLHWTRVLQNSGC